MCNILKMADRRLQRMNIWDLWAYELHMYGNFHVHFSLNSLCKSSAPVHFAKFQETPPTIFIQFQPNNFYGKYHNWGRRTITFFAICQIKELASTAI